MIHIGLKGYQRWTMIQNAVFKSLLNGGRYLAHIGVALADELIVTDTNDIGHEGDHCCGLADGLAMSDLRFTLVQIHQLETKKVRARCIGETRAS